MLPSPGLHEVRQGPPRTGVRIKTNERHVARDAGPRWTLGRIVQLTCVAILAVVSTGATWFTLDLLYHTLWSRRDLPDVGSFTRFEFPAIGRVYDANGQPLIEFAREYREITQYRDIPPIVRDAILAS